MSEFAFNRIRPTKLRFYLRYMANRNFSEKQVLKGTPLNAQALADDNNLVEISDYIRVVSNIMRLVKKPELAFEMGAALRPGDFGILGHAVSACPNALEAFEVWKKYGHLFFGNLFTSEQRSWQQSVEYEFIPRVKLLPKISRFLIEEKVIFETILFNRFNNSTPKYQYYSFSYPRPAYVALYDQLLKCEGQFDADKTLFRFAGDDPEYTEPFPRADAETLSVCIEHLEQVTRIVNTQTTFSARVRLSIRNHLPEILSAAKIASLYNMSTRTFSRNLELEDSNYHNELVKVRSQMARDYLATTSLDATELARMLGYQDVGSLRRTFRSWTGMTLSEYRNSFGAATRA